MPVCMLAGRANHGAVGTEHATIARLGAQQRTATGTFVEKNARVVGHGVALCVAALRTGENGFVDDGVGVCIHEKLHAVWFHYHAAGLCPYDVGVHGHGFKAHARIVKGMLM